MSLTEIPFRSVKLKEFSQAAVIQQKGGISETPEIDLKHVEKWEKFIHGPHAAGIAHLQVHVGAQMFPWDLFEEHEKAGRIHIMRALTEDTSYSEEIHFTLVTSKVEYTVRLTLLQIPKLTRFLRLQRFTGTADRLKKTLKTYISDYDRQSESAHRTWKLAESRKATLQTALDAVMSGMKKPKK